MFQYSNGILLHHQNVEQFMFAIIARLELLYSSGFRCFFHSMNNNQYKLGSVYRANMPYVSGVLKINSNRLEEVPSRGGSIHRRGAIQLIPTRVDQITKS